MLDKKVSQKIVEGLEQVIQGVNKILEVDFEIKDGDVNDYLLVEGYEEVAPHEQIFPNLSLDEWVAVLYEYKEFLEEKLLKD